MDQKEETHKTIFTEEEENAINVLQSKESSFDLIRSYWKVSFNLRKARMPTFGTPLDYFNAFPFLRTPLGYTLLIEDCLLRFPELRERSLHKIWPKVGSVVIELLKSKQIEHRELYSTSIDMNVKSVKLIPFLFAPPQIRMKTTKKNVKLSRMEMADRFFLQVSDSDELESKIAERRQQLKDSTSSPHPFMVALGQSSKIQAYFVVIDDQKYSFNDCLTAMDTAFKIFHALNIPYPNETRKIWQTIDYLVYRIIKLVEPGASVVVGEIEQKLNEL
ncbi:hypothetical protein JTB14_021645 [Gonioctena quinquepunctata]|nr:hypothetical protein JTB14_021645 [Gonioctena quinquepunctata]